MSLVKSILFSAVCMAVIGSVANATTPKKSVALDKNLQLVMLSLNKEISAFSASSKNKSVKAKQAIVKMRLPRNCMLWDTHQINQKAHKFEKSINQYARQHNLDRNLIVSVITAESCFRTKALSSAGAQGLMQLIPDTAKRFGVKNSYNPKQNIRGGVRYLKFLFDRYKGDLRKTLAAYNAGEGKVDQYKGIPPYKETKQYVKNVLKVYAMLNPKFANKNKRVKAVYYPPSLGQKPGRHGWQYNRRLAPHLYKTTTSK